jgi:hypothetical protein
MVCRKLQQPVVSVIVHGCICSNSAARSLLKVEIVARTGGRQITRPDPFSSDRPAPNPGGFGENSSAICTSFVSRSAFLAAPSGRSLQYEWGKFMIIVIKGFVCWLAGRCVCTFRGGRAWSQDQVCANRSRESDRYLSRSRTGRVHSAQMGQGL